MWLCVQVRINYANPDMVGHTGDLKASMQACATVDKCLKDLLAVCDEVGGRFLVTSDHGNSDDMVQREKKTNKPLVDQDTGARLGGWAGRLGRAGMRRLAVFVSVTAQDCCMQPVGSTNLTGARTAL